jgi:hypothetical protein
MADIQQFSFSFDCFIAEDVGTVTLQTLAANLTTAATSPKS